MKSYSILINRKALSYCCGSAEDSHPILLNGQWHDVTKNLESALQRLRYVRGLRSLWIDALWSLVSFLRIFAIQRCADFSDEVPNPFGGIDYAIRTTTHRRLFTTTKGYLGIGPHLRGHGWPLREETFVLPGGQTPFLLRQAGERCVPGHGSSHVTT